MILSDGVELVDALATKSLLAIIISKNNVTQVRFYLNNKSFTSVGYMGSKIPSQYVALGQVFD